MSHYWSLYRNHCWVCFFFESIASVPTHVCMCVFIQELYLCFPVHPAINLPPVMADMTDLRACQVPSVQSWSHVTPPAACQKLIVLIGERQSCNKALRGDPPTQMKALRFGLCQGLVGNRRVRWPAGQEGRTTVLWPVCVCEDRRRWVGEHKLEDPSTGSLLDVRIWRL